MNRFIDLQGWSTGTVSEAINRFYGDLTVRRSGPGFDRQRFLNMGLQFAGPYSLTGLGPAYLNQVFAWRCRAEMVVKTDHAVDFRSRQIQCSGDVGYDFIGDVAKFVLYLVQNGQ